MTLCQVCKKNRANTHIKKVVNGESTELMLCEECAAKLGYTNIFNEFGFDFDNFLGSFFSNSLNYENKRCDSCGSSFIDISSTGKVGCAKCYDIFIDQLTPTIKRIHGNTKHSGKRAIFADKKDNIKDKINSLNEKMQIAIKEQNFEEAAKIRDEIKDLKSHIDN